ncbi:MAG: hypothetical protein IKT98_02260 [Selenomonadaceae bacterium]|nr:hypothetical protein [Selenomonadaceae bacterium]
MLTEFYFIIYRHSRIDFEVFYGIKRAPPILEVLFLIGKDVVAESVNYHANYHR